MTDLDTNHICRKAKNKANCYKCIARIQQLLQVEDLEPADRVRVEEMAKAFEAGNDEPSELDIALLVRLSDHYLT